jgi:hypothetical protein
VIYTHTPEIWPYGTNQITPRALGGKTYDAETVHDIHLGTLKDEFCDLEYTDEVVRRLAVVD